MARIKVEITHADRMLFPADGITKGDLVRYYSQVAGVMVPYLKGPPLTVWRFRRGIGEKGDPWGGLHRHTRSLSRPKQRLSKVRGKSA